MSQDIRIGTFIRAYMKFDSNKTKVGKIINIERIIHKYENREGLIDKIKNLQVNKATKYIIKLSDNSIISREYGEFDIITKQEYFLEAL